MSLSAASFQNVKRPYPLYAMMTLFSCRRRSSEKSPKRKNLRLLKKSGRGGNSPLSLDSNSCLSGSAAALVTSFSYSYSLSVSASYTSSPDAVATFPFIDFSLPEEPELVVDGGAEKTNTEFYYYVGLTLLVMNYSYALF